jgi:tyrosyl-tRNA synthetase
MYKSEFLNEINSRGFIYQGSDLDALDSLMNKKNITGYIGFDPTSDSLHIGSLVQLMLLNWMQHYGHHTIALMGGGTTLVGDPSGKDEIRKILDIKEINKNIEKIKVIFSNFINLQKNAKILNNHLWLSSQNYIEFLRKVGAKITVNKMLTYDSIASRLDREQPLTFLEFNYMLLQAYDFLYLYENYDCILQLGGSDQWGNIINGIDLIRKTHNSGSYAITSPLVTNSDGSKMGKTVDGAIWLSENKLSNFEFFQFWRNIEDINVERFLKLFTKIDLSEIKRLSKLKNKEINEAKKILAYETTKICRGEKSANEALEMSLNLFESKIIDTRVNSLSVSISKILKDEFNIIDATSQLGLTKSRSDAKRIIKSGGLKINNTTVSNEEYSLKNYLNNTENLKIVVGKKKIGIIKLLK